MRYTYTYIYIYRCLYMNFYTIYINIYTTLTKAYCGYKYSKKYTILLKSNKLID